MAPVLPRLKSLAHTLGWRLEAAGWDALSRWFARMPIEEASDAGGRWARRVGPLTSAHQTALRNIRLAFPDAGEARVRDIALGCWETIGRTAGEFSHLGELKAYQPGGRVIVQGVERLDEVMASGRGAVFVAGHFANWEVMAAAILHRGARCQITYRHANNPFIDARITAIRRAYGVVDFAPKGAHGARELLAALQRGESAALMNDQKMNDGVAVPFFGHLAMTAPGPTRLAMRFGAPLIPISTLRDAPGRFTVTFHEPIKVSTNPDHGAAVIETVTRISAFMEARIREAPEQWFWVHRRWPGQSWKTAGV